VIHHFFARIVRPLAVSDKHFHPAPGGVGIFPLQFAAKLNQQLADARLLNRKVQPDKTQRRGFLAENRRGAKRPHHFVVAHVDDPQVALGPRAVAGNGQNDVRVDGRDARVDDFETRVRIRSLNKTSR